MTSMITTAAINLTISIEAAINLAMSRREGACHGTFHSLGGTPVAIGEGRYMNSTHEWSITSPVDGLTVRNGHSADGAAMEATLEGDDIGPSSSMARKLDSSFYSFGAAVTEEKLVYSFRNNSLQLFGELKDRLMVGDSHLHVHELSDLFLGSLDDLRVAVAGVGDANTAGEVKQFLSTGGVDIATLPTFNDEVRYAGPYRGQDALGVLKAGGPVHGFLDGGLREVM